MVCQNLEKLTSTSRYEYSSASYRSRIFAMAKKGGIRLVQDVQELNKLTVHDSGLPLHIDDFAEEFVRRIIYGLAVLFSGYDGRPLAFVS